MTVLHLLPPYHLPLDTRSQPLYHFPLILPFNLAWLSSQVLFILDSHPTMPLAAQSFTLSSAVWAAVNSSNNNPFFVWESILDINRLQASNLGSLSLTELQSSVYSLICASSSVCIIAGTCASGFIGTSCESCAPAFFDSKCQPCPSDCTMMIVLPVQEFV